MLRDVSLELAPGPTLAVIGANGAGKSTLLRILATLLRPSAGEVEVLGAALPREAWKVRGRIGYLGHEPLLYRELSVRENLEFNARLHGSSDPASGSRPCSSAPGSPAAPSELVRNLSAGMLQRAAICRALLHEPELLLLDEPRSHLDLGAARGRRRAARARPPGATRVVVTHEIESGLAEADAGPGAARRRLGRLRRAGRRARGRRRPGDRRGA